MPTKQETYQAFGFLSGAQETILVYLDEFLSSPVKNGLVTFNPAIMVDSMKLGIESYKLLSSIEPSSEFLPGINKALTTLVENLKHTKLEDGKAIAKTEVTQIQQVALNELANEIHKAAMKVQKSQGSLAGCNEVVEILPDDAIPVNQYCTGVLSPHHAKVFEGPTKQLPIGKKTVYIKYPQQISHHLGAHFVEVSPKKLGKDSDFGIVYHDSGPSYKFSKDRLNGVAERLKIEGFSCSKGKGGYILSCNGKISNEEIHRLAVWFSLILDADLAHNWPSGVKHEDITNIVKDSIWEMAGDISKKYGADAWQKGPPTPLSWSEIYKDYQVLGNTTLYDDIRHLIELRDKHHELIHAAYGVEASHAGGKKISDWEPLNAVIKNDEEYVGILKKIGAPYSHIASAIQGVKQVIATKNAIPWHEIDHLGNSMHTTAAQLLHDAGKYGGCPISGTNMNTGNLALCEGVLQGIPTEMTGDGNDIIQNVGPDTYITHTLDEDPEGLYRVDFSMKGSPEWTEKIKAFLKKQYGFKQLAPNKFQFQSKDLDKIRTLSLFFSNLKGASAALGGECGDKAIQLAYDTALKQNAKGKFAFTQQPLHQNVKQWLSQCQAEFGIMPPGMTKEEIAIMELIGAQKQYGGCSFANTDELPNTGDIVYCEGVRKNPQSNINAFLAEDGKLYQYYHGAPGPDHIATIGISPLGDGKYAVDMSDISFGGSILQKEMLKYFKENWGLSCPTDGGCSGTLSETSLRRLAAFISSVHQLYKTELEACVPKGVEYAFQEVQKLPDDVHAHDKIVYPWTTQDWQKSVCKGVKGEAAPAKEETVSSVGGFKVGDKVTFATSKAKHGIPNGMLPGTVGTIVKVEPPSNVYIDFGGNITYWGADVKDLKHVEEPTGEFKVGDKVVFNTSLPEYGPAPGYEPGMVGEITSLDLTSYSHPMAWVKFPSYGTSWGVALKDLSHAPAETTGGFHFGAGFQWMKPLDTFLYHSAHWSVPNKLQVLALIDMGMDQKSFVSALEKQAYWPSPVHHLPSYAAKAYANTFTWPGEAPAKKPTSKGKKIKLEDLEEYASGQVQKQICGLKDVSTEIEDVLTWFHSQYPEVSFSAATKKAIMELYDECPVVGEEKPAESKLDQLIEEQDKLYSELQHQFFGNQEKAQKCKDAKSYKALPQECKDLIHAYMNLVLLKSTKEGTSEGEVLETVQSVVHTTFPNLTPKQIELQLAIEKKNKIRKGELPEEPGEVVAKTIGAMEPQEALDVVNFIKQNAPEYLGNAGQLQLLVQKQYGIEPSDMLFAYIDKAIMEAGAGKPPFEEELQSPEEYQQHLTELVKEIYEGHPEKSMDAKTIQNLVSNINALQLANAGLLHEPTEDEIIESIAQLTVDGVIEFSEPDGYFKLKSAAKTASPYDIYVVLKDWFEAHPNTTITGFGMVQIIEDAGYAKPDTDAIGMAINTLFDEQAIIHAGSGWKLADEEEVKPQPSVSDIAAAIKLIKEGKPYAGCFPAQPGTELTETQAVYCEGIMTPPGAKKGSYVSLEANPATGEVIPEVSQYPDGYNVVLGGAQEGALSFSFSEVGTKGPQWKQRQQQVAEALVDMDYDCTFVDSHFVCLRDGLNMDEEGDRALVKTTALFLSSLGHVSELPYTCISRAVRYALSEAYNKEKSYSQPWELKPYPYTVEEWNKEVCSAQEVKPVKEKAMQKAKELGTVKLLGLANANGINPAGSDAALAQKLIEAGIIDP